MAAKVFGGWYLNPATGKTQRWWGGDAWTNGEDPTQGLGPNWQKILSSGGSADNSGINSNPLESVNKIIQDSFQSLQSEVAQKFGEYRAGQPFKIDDVLAEKGSQAAEQIDPYYNEALTNYLTGVKRKIERGTTDTKDLLTELSANTESYTGQAKLALNESVNKAEQGFAESGLFGSGEQLRTEGLLKTDTGNNLADYTRKSDYQKRQLDLGLSRNLEDIGSDKSSFVRDLERSRFTDTEQRKADLAKEAGQQYISGFKATLPPQLQAASGFDLLKDLGIYS